jgi:hypothetical protein
MGRHGIQISQEGVPLSRAADYQKVLDDQWPFLDIFLEKEIQVSKSDWPSSTAWWVYELAEHNLGYLPGFTFKENGTSLITGDTSVIATDKKIYLRGLWVTGDPTTPLDIRIFIRVFAVDITKEYQYTGERIAPQPRVSAKKYGVKIVDPRDPNSRMGDQEMSSFSLNTNAKALGVFKTGIQDINPWSRDTSATVTGINTSTDVFTSSGSIDWSNLHGHACVYSPADFVTYPAPLNTSTYYIIPLTPTTFKLASTYNNAMAGVAIDITTTGSLNGTLSSRDNPSVPTNIITHNAGYPPTYMLATYNPDGVGGAFADPLNNVPTVTPLLLNGPAVKITTTNTTMALVGVQSVYSERVAYLIIRDPAEVAG